MSVRKKTGERHVPTILKVAAQQEPSSSGGVYEEGKCCSSFPMVGRCTLTCRGLDGTSSDDRPGEMGEDAQEHSLESVKRKRRAKMNRHKYRKRLKKLRFVRRKLGQ